MTDKAPLKGGDIWLSDVIEAWRTLQLTTPEERAAAAEALGFDAAGLRPAIESSVSPVETTAGPVDASKSGDSEGPVTHRAAAARVIPSFATEQVVAELADHQSWAVDAPALQAEQSAHVGFTPSHVPLFRPHWTRHLLSTICSVPILEGAIDEPRLIDAVTRLRPITRLPRRPRPTVRRGVQVLIDRGESMLPFTRDVDDILRALRDTVGKDQLVAAAFVGTPLAGEGVMRLRTRKRAEWQTPPAGTRILVVTDLGLAQRQGEVRGATTGEWLTFAARCRAGECRPVVILPRNAGACPPPFRRVFDIIQWDPRTSVATVLRQVRASL